MDMRAKIVARICGPGLRMDMRSQGHGLAKNARPVWARIPLTHISGLTGRGPASGSSSGSLRSGVRSPGSSRPAPVGLNVGCRRVLADKGARKGALPFLTLPVPGKVFLLAGALQRYACPGKRRHMSRRHRMDLRTYSSHGFAVIAWICEHPSLHCKDMQARAKGVT